MCIEKREQFWEEDRQLLPAFRRKEYDHRKYFQTIVRDERPKNEYWSRVYCNVLHNVHRRAAASYISYFAAVKVYNGNPKEKPRPPKRSKKSDYNSFTFESGAGFSLEDSKLTMSMLGSCKIKLHRLMLGAPKTLTIKREMGKYYAIFSCEIPEEEMEMLPETGEIVGLDMGSTTMVVTSDDKQYGTEHIFDKQLQDKLKDLQRKLSRQKRFSNGWKKTVGELKMVHAKIARKRTDQARKISHSLLSDYDIIFCEDLKLREMLTRNNGSDHPEYILKNARKGMYDRALGKFVKTLEEKAGVSKKHVLKVNPRGTTQTCHACGADAPKDLTDRTHKCPECGIELDRDLNSAINILNRGIEAYPDILSNHNSAKIAGD